MNRTVLVTGGATGIGRAVAGRSAADGADVVITGRRRAVPERTVAELEVRAVACDGADPAQLAGLARHPPPVPHVLVNTAGGLADVPAGGADPLAELRAQWQAELSQNPLTAVPTTAAVRDRLADGGAVISLGSLGAERRGGAYGGAKAALAAWNAALSAQLGPQGVTCNVISAGYVAGTGFFGDRTTAQRHAALAEENHTKRPGQLEDTAATAHFLASPGARHLTGRTLHVNGGAFTTRRARRPARARRLTRRGPAPPGRRRGAAPRG